MKNQSLSRLPIVSECVQTWPSSKVRISNFSQVNAHKLFLYAVLLLDDAQSVATLSLSTANVDVDLREGGMLVTARLGTLQLLDDSPLEPKVTEFKKLLSIEGDEFAELRYETFSPAVSTKRGINSSVDLRTGSLKLHFLETPLNSLYIFLLKFARLKGIYDAAAEAAVQRAAKVEKMAFRVSVRSPVVVFPVEPTKLGDAFILKLGELSTRNKYEGPAQLISGSLSGIRLASWFYKEDKVETKIINDVNISTEIVQTAPDELQPSSDVAEFKVRFWSDSISHYSTSALGQSHCFRHPPSADGAAILWSDETFSTNTGCILRLFTGLNRCTSNFPTAKGGASRNFNGSIART